LPAWLAVIVVLPTPTKLIVLPLTVATLVLELVYETGRPALDTAVNVRGLAPYVTADIAGNVIVWEAWVTLRVWLVLGAAE
jgi:hypothetical protein